jgi:2,3-dihydroxybenzoate decarboxylase
MTDRRISVEEHFLGPGFDQDPSVFEPSLARYIAARTHDFVEHRLTEMDAAGVDMQVLSLAAPGLQAVADPAVAASQARAINDFLAEVVRAHPDRFAGWAAVPTIDPQAGADELERAVRELGMRGAMINGHTGGVYLDDPRFLPLWERVADLGVPLYIHPVNAPGTWATVEGYPEIATAAWGWAAETGSHALRLVFSGLFERFPQLTLILGHMGELLPFNLWRLDDRAKTMFVDAHPLPHPPSHYLKQNLMVSTSGVFSDVPLLACRDALGADRIMFAVDYPYQYMADGVQWLEGALIDEREREMIFHGNAERLLGLTAADRA